MRFLSLLLIIGLCTFVGTAQAQESEESSSVMAVSWYKCQLNKLGEVNDLVTEYNEPVLNRLVDEKKLMGWGSMNHRWGDEWSFMLYYEAKDMESLDNAMDEFMQEMSKMDKSAEERFFSLCTEHKDNIYTTVHGYYGSDE